MRIFSCLATLTLCTVLLSAASDAAAVVFKIATLTPDGSTWMKVLRAGGEEVKNRTDGRVEFKFYPGGVMGNDQYVLRKIRSGQLHGAVLTAGGLTQTYAVPQSMVPVVPSRTSTILPHQVHRRGGIEPKA